METEHDFLSRSLMLPRESKESRGKPLKYVELPTVKEEKDKVAVENLSKIDKYSVFVQDEIQLKYAMNKIIMDFGETMDLSDPSKLSSPFMPNTFSLWRQHAYKKFQTLTKNQSFATVQRKKLKFIEDIDNKLLPKFAMRLKEPYFNLIFQKNYCLPRAINGVKAKQELELYEEMSGLAAVVSLWCLNVEILADLLERASLYGYYDLPKEKKHVVEDLKGKWDKKIPFTARRFTKIIIFKILQNSIKHLSSFFMAKGFNFKSISLGASVAIIYYIAGAAAFPWGFIMSRISVPWICGGYLGAQVANKLSVFLHKKEYRDDILLLSDIFRKMIENLEDLNYKIKESIYLLAQETNEKEFKIQKQAIGFKISNLLNVNDITDALEIKEQKDLNGASEDLTYDLILMESKRVENENWVFIDHGEFVEVDADDDFVLVETKTKVGK